MKKFRLILVLLALVMLSIPVQAQEDDGPPLGSLGNGELRTDHRPAPAKTQQQEQAAGREIRAEAFSYPPYPLEDTFLLHSCPTATKTIFLDFDGFVGVWYRYKPFNFEGNPNDFSDAELTMIQQAWQSVSEDFLSFDVDVTTEDPGVEALRNTGGDDVEWGQRVVVGSRWQYSWAYMGTFSSSIDQECFAYQGDPPTWIWIADSASHELGHTCWVDEHGQVPGDGGYYHGHGSGNTFWAPIMGWTKMSVPYGLSQWDKGEYLNATPDPPEDALELITTLNGFGYRSDDHGSTTSTATAVDISQSFVAEGIIEQNTDVDYFEFTMSSSGPVHILINDDMHPSDADHLSSNLDILAKIYDSGEAVLYTSNPVHEIYAEFDVILDAGDYYLSIEGVGLNDPLGPPDDGYSDYGCLGYYAIETIPPDLDPPTPDPMTWAVVPTPGTSEQVVDSYGFEVPDQGDSGYTYTPSGSVWTFTGGSGLAGPTSPWICSSTSPDPLGDQFAFLQSTAAISKDLTSLAIGATYELSFFESYRVALASGNDLSVILDEGLGTEVTIYNNPSVTNTTWEARTTSQFVAAKTSYTLTFRTTNPLGGDRSTIIDGLEVSVFTDPDTSISMTAATASDPSGVEYYFDEITGNPGGTDSGWQDSTFYVNTGLTPGTLYTYTVTARDKSASQNETAASTAESATTDSEPQPDTDPPTPNPATFATAPTAVSSTEITMTATTGSDATGPVWYFFDETTGGPGADDSGWVTDPVYNDTGLDPDTEYTYTVTMCDSVTPTPNVGTTSAPASATTDPAGQAGLTDDFEGTLANWSTDWDLVTDYYQSATHSVQCSSEDNDLISIDVDTSGASTNVRVQFKYRISGIDANDNVSIYYWDGGAYDFIDEIGDDAQDTWLTYDHTTTDAQYRNSTFKIYIEGTPIDPDEFLWIDDVSITCQ